MDKQKLDYFRKLLLSQRGKPLRTFAPIEPLPLKVAME